MNEVSESSAIFSSESLAARIQQHRTAAVQLVLTDRTGAPLRNRPVVVRMVRHRFLFGCNAFALHPGDTSAVQRAYQDRFVRIFNFATLGFYWSAFEPEPGRVETERCMAQAEWLGAHGVTIKGHPLVWRQTVPAWLPDDIRSVRDHVQGRITRDVSAFAGVIGMWDVINEVTDWDRMAAQHRNPLTHYYQQVGAVELVREVFAAARQAAPGATLLLNDYQTGTNYAGLVQACLAAGVPIDAIGIQSHMHAGPWRREQVWKTLERFAAFKVPLHFTETTVPSGAPREAADINWLGHHDDWPTTPEGEERQAGQVEDFYRLLFSHPAVQAITWWDFSDAGAWMGAPAGLVRADMSPKPAYQVLERLIRGEWWTPDQALTTDAHGKLAVRGFLGDYEVAVDGGVARFALDHPGQLVLSL
ncbi:MAG: endo-1,4-beta-xylanase [Lentisphaerae bacterium]|nr:endo-1,4-beta-xylanase [Lentisphaerota bacterium]